MAVGAHEDAFVRLAARTFDAAKEAAEGEVLRARIAMMEFERPDGVLVATILAAPASCSDELAFDPYPTAPAVADPRLAPTDTRVIEGTRRGVVRAEWRARRAEPSAAQHP